MPYPIVHVLFFIFCVSLPGLYGFFNSIMKEKIFLHDWEDLLFLLTISGIGSLLPDIPFVWNFLIYGNSYHISVFGIPTHSLLFSISAIIIGIFAGFFMYKNINKAYYTSMLTLSAFFSHLLLDDVARGEITYLYPLYNVPMSIFSYVNVEFSNVNILYYTIAGIIAIFFLFFILLMNLIAFNGLGFVFEYKK